MEFKTVNCELTFDRLQDESCFCLGSVEITGQFNFHGQALLTVSNYILSLPKTNETSVERYSALSVNGLRK